MKKLLTAVALTAALGTASAAEMAVTQGRDMGTNERNATGLALSQKYQGFDVGLGFDRATRGNRDQDRYNVHVARDVISLGPVRAQALLSAHYLDNQTGQDGYAVSSGLGVRLPVTKAVSLGVDVTRQWGQQRVSAFDGNRVTGSVRFAF